MPMIMYKEKIKYNSTNDNITIAFDCEYDDDYHLKLKNFEPNYFDSGDYRIKIEKVARKFDSKIMEQYRKKCHGVDFLAISKYFIDEIPAIYSIKFESVDSESIYYSDEIRKIFK